MDRLTVNFTECKYYFQIAALNMTKIYSKEIWKDSDADPCWSLPNDRLAFHSVDLVLQPSQCI